MYMCDINITVGDAPGMQIMLCVTASAVLRCVPARDGVSNHKLIRVYAVPGHDPATVLLYFRV